MYCNYCGKVIQDDANVCAYCGKTVVGVAARKTLLRSRADRKIAGVCLGFAEYFDLDITLVRVLWVLAVIFAIPLGILGYIVSWIIIPEEPLYVAAPQQASTSPVPQG